MDDDIRVIPADPVDQETADAMSAILKFFDDEISRLTVDVMLGPECVPTSGQLKELLMRGRLGDHPNP